MTSGELFEIAEGISHLAKLRMPHLHINPLLSDNALSELADHPPRRLQVRVILVTWEIPNALQLRPDLYD